MIFRYKGWFGICPIYLTDPSSDAPDVVARHKLLEPVFTFSEWVYGIIIFMKSWIDVEYEPSWPMVITGEGEFDVKD